MKDIIKIEDVELAPKDIIKIEDDDGKLHLYICAAVKGDRWVTQIIFDGNTTTPDEFKHNGDRLISATSRALLRKKIIIE